MDMLRIYKLFSYDLGFFKYGILLLDGKNNDIVVHPNEKLDEKPECFQDIEKFLQKKFPEISISQ